MPEPNKSLTNREAHSLFAKFAAPIFRAAKSPSQRVGAQQLAEMLWLALVTGKDTEAFIWKEIKKFGIGSEDIQIIKDRYYNEMKPSITPAEIQALKVRYKVKRK